MHGGSPSPRISASTSPRDPVGCPIVCEVSDGALEETCLRFCKLKVASSLMYFSSLDIHVGIGTIHDQPNSMMLLNKISQAHRCSGKSEYWSHSVVDD